jgi:hypothetical protein
MFFHGVSLQRRMIGVRTHRRNRAPDLSRPDGAEEAAVRAHPTGTADLPAMGCVPMAGPLRFLPRRRGAAVPTLSRDEGLREAYTAHGAELYRFALRSLDDPMAAEDVVQETFLRAWRGSERYDPSLSTLRTWLFSLRATPSLTSSGPPRCGPGNGRSWT